MPTEDDKTKLAKSKLNIQPPSESAAEESKPAEPEPEPDAQAETPETEEPKESETPAPEEATEAEPAVAEESETAPATEDGQTKPTEAEGQEGQPGQEEPPKPEPHIEPLFDEHGVIVSSHEHHRRHSGLKAFLAVLFVLLLAAATLDVLLDMEILNLEGLPHTDFL